MAEKRLASPLKFHGGKSKLARRIVALMPDHLHYVEPFAGALHVLFARPRAAVSEVVNDLSGDLTNFWRVLQGESTFTEFCRLAQATPFSEAEWTAAGEGLASGHDAGDVRRALWFFVRVRQSLAGRQDTFAPLTRARLRRGMNEQASAWLSAVEGLAAVHARLSRVAILCRPALEVIRGQDGPRTLFYLDPPYPHPTRATAGQYGAYEMSEADHAELLAAVRQVRGKVMLSGYACPLYDEALAGWTRHAFDVVKHSGGGKKKGQASEVVWCNF